MAFEKVDADNLRKLLRHYSLGKRESFDTLWSELDPIFEADRETEENKYFAKLGNPNIIGISIKSSVRLQVQSHATAIILHALHSPENKPLDELFAPAGPLFDWAIGSDIQRSLPPNSTDALRQATSLKFGNDPPNESLNELTEDQFIFGESLFHLAICFILLHELAHLKYCDCRSTPENEKRADLFAASWLCDGASMLESGSDVHRLIVLYGISNGLLWLTNYNIFLGQKGAQSHPEPYDRLFQVLDSVIDVTDEEESLMVWYFVARLLTIHMLAAGFDFDEQDQRHLKCHPRERVNHLIDRISCFQKKGSPFGPYEVIT